MNARIHWYLVFSFSPLTLIAGQAHESFGLEKMLEQVPAVAGQIKPSDERVSVPSLIEYRASQASKPSASDVPVAKAVAAAEEKVDWGKMREEAFKKMGLGEHRKPQPKAVESVTTQPEEDPLKIPFVVSRSARDRLVAAAVSSSKPISRSLAGTPKELSSLARRGYAASHAAYEAPSRAHKKAAESTSAHVGYAPAQ
jgi:hypothetical protein